MGELPSKCKVMYLARDKNGDLFLYGLEPEKLEARGMFMSNGYVDKLNNLLFSNVTWENSPVFYDENKLITCFNLDDACEWLRHNASKYTVGNILAEDFKEAMIEKMG